MRHRYNQFDQHSVHWTTQLTGMPGTTAACPAAARGQQCSVDRSYGRTHSLLSAATFLLLFGRACWKASGAPSRQQWSEWAAGSGQVPGTAVCLLLPPFCHNTKALLTSVFSKPATPIPHRCKLTMLLMY